MANSFLPIPASKGAFKIRGQDSDDDSYDSDAFGFRTMQYEGKKPSRKRKTTQEPQDPLRESSQRAAPSTSAPALHNTRLATTARSDHVDLTRSDDDNDSSEAREEPGKRQNSPSKEMDSAGSSADVDEVLDATLLPENHETKFLDQARLQFTSERPPFVRLKKNAGPTTVTLASKDGQLPETELLASLVSRQWDSDNSFYTLDRNGQRLIVKPFGGRSIRGGRGGTAYRTWSGHGNVFLDAPIASAFKGDTEEQPSNSKDVRDDLGDDLESDFGEIYIQHSDSINDADYSSTTSEGSALEREAQQGSDYQAPMTRSAISEIPATQGLLAHFTTRGEHEDTRRPEDARKNELGPAPRARSPLPQPSPSGPSNAGSKVSEVVLRKRPARDTIDNNCSSKRVRPATFNISSTTAKIPRSLTLYKQEHTILYILLPGRTSEMVPIKLRSALTISTLFSSVSAAAGVTDYKHMSIAVMLEGENGGEDNTIIVRQNMIDSFEVFLEIVDAATCWEEEGGRMVLHLQLRWPFEMDVRV